MYVCNSSQENSSLTSQLASLKQSLQESQEQSARLHSELRKAKSATKSPGGGGADGRGQLERVGELEGRLRQVDEDNTSLQVCGVCVCFVCIIACLQAVMISR